METKKKWSKMLVMGMSALVLAFGLLLVGCDNSGPDPDPTYTVWTDSSSYSDFYTAFSTTLNDGQYLYLEFTNSQFAGLSLGNDGKHVWTESQIYDWFIGRGFDNATATQRKAWLMTIDHGFIASRSGSTVYMLIK